MMLAFRESNQENRKAETSVVAEGEVQTKARAAARLANCEDPGH